MQHIFSVSNVDELKTFLEQLPKPANCFFGVGSGSMPTQRDIEEFSFKWISDFGPRGAICLEDADYVLTSFKNSI